MIRIILIFLCFQILEVSNAQNYSFTWNMIPSMDYHVITFKIKMDGVKTILTLKEIGSKDSISKRILSSDLDSIYNILINHKYRFQDNIFQDSGKKIYLTTKILNEKWLIVNGDSIRKECIWLKGWEFDPDSNKCYEKNGFSIACTDGITYEGYFQTKNKNKKYSVQCCFMTVEECTINQIDLDLIKKYQLNRGLYSRYLEQVEDCKPSKYLINNK